MVVAVGVIMEVAHLNEKVKAQILVVAVDHHIFQDIPK